MSACSGASDPLWARNPLHQLLQQLLHPEPGLRAHQRRIVRRDADDFLYFVNDLGRVSRREIDLVDDRQDFEPLLEGRIAVATLCASTPWAASTTKSAPSQAASERETS